MKHLVFILALLLNSLIVNQLAAQNTAAHIPGDLLVSLRLGTSPEQVVERLNQTWANKPANLLVVKKVADPMNIWLFHSNLETESEELRMLEILRQQPGVAVAQFNHIVEDRTTFDPSAFSKEMEAAQKQLFSKRQSSAVRRPSSAVEKMMVITPDDPGFAQQWQYINTGGSGGVADADTDIELAWDVTTGGLTPQGDTIVVCVVDGGVNINHPDFGDNIWKNWAEIPGNGIDDDQNGYKDDFRGWSTYSNSDNITVNAGHGTAVAGIVGAQGNNGVGVAGVNWNVKIMVVAGGGAEANVLASYSYPFLFRKKYNETGGQAGAFVVATNSSWGTDFGQPADAPLWCAFYDTLGKVGILSCGATINGNTDVDVQGDLPTACPSDFLISVTNCGRNGKKVTSAGYGTTTIDIGSFGENAWTLSTNSYAGFGGTSGATPHVAGTVGLLYSAPCASFTALAKADPALAALNLKKYILDSVDLEPTLAGKTVTGGRLNIDKAMKNLLASCSSCPAPFSIVANAVTDTSAAIFFNKLDTGAVVNLRWQVAGSGSWTVENGVKSPFLFQNLDPCTFYNVELEMACADSTSGWSPTKTFKTDGCCDPVANLLVTGLTANGATFLWSPVTAAMGYVVEILAGGPPTTFPVDASQTSFTVNSLPPCSIFQVIVHTFCAGGQDVWTSPIAFKTKGCGLCEEGNYCPTEGGNSAEEWIDKVEFANLSHQNSPNSPGYVNSIAESATVEQFHVYDLKLMPGFPSNAFNEYFRAWADWDQNGQFDDPAERIFDSGTAQSSAVSAPVFVGNFPTGIARMRVAMKYVGINGTKPQPCDANFQYGQVKDFCVDVQPGQPECLPIPSINLLAKTDTSATLDWPAVPFATGYIVKLNKKGETATQDFTVATNQVLLKNLTICTDYEANIWPKCGAIEQPTAAYLLFKTECGVGTFSPVELAGVSVAPNPFSDQLTISLFAEKMGEAVIELFTVNGQLVENQRVVFAAGENRFLLETAKTGTGAYFLRIKTADGVAVRRVVKG